MGNAQNHHRLPSLADAAWLARPETQAVIAALAGEGAGVRAVGGAVRNALMGLPVKDVDLATTALPQDVMRLAEQAGMHAIPTGIEHGTVTVVTGKMPFEVTTLRRDIETFGRHARVTFTDDWREDAMRRDFTMNALYCDADGTVHDPLGGYADLAARRVRFIGEARQRIREDYLRSLRFFRFAAQYGDAARLDAEGVAAVKTEREGLTHLSGERIRAELLLLLAAPGAVEAVAGMREAEIIEPLLGTAGDVGAVGRLAAIEAALARPADPLLRLAALAGADPERLRTRLRLSSAEAKRVAAAVQRDEALDPRRSEAAAKAYIYRHGAEAFIDGTLMAWARSGDEAASAEWTARVRLAEQWKAPQLPVRGADVLALGAPAGPQVGNVVAAFETWWVAAGFPDDAQQNRAKLQELARLHHERKRERP